MKLKERAVIEHMEYLEIAFVALLCVPILYVSYIFFSKLVEEFFKKGKKED